MAFVFALRATLALELLARVTDLRVQGVDALRCAFEFESELSAASAEGLQLLVGGGGFLVQSLRFAIERGDALFSLRQPVAHRRRG